MVARIAGSSMRMTRPRAAIVEVLHDRDPNKPFENEAMRAAAKTWAGDFYTKGGGNAWDGFAYDPDVYPVYVGTGNAEPWTQKFRGTKSMGNLYTRSILTVGTTGNLKWHFQTVPNDNWEAAKNGFFYALDRVSVQFISGHPFTKVNWDRGLRR